MSLLPKCWLWTSIFLELKIWPGIFPSRFCLQLINRGKQRVADFLFPDLHLHSKIEWIFLMFFWKHDLTCYFTIPASGPSQVNINNKVYNLISFPEPVNKLTLIYTNKQDNYTPVQLCFWPINGRKLFGKIDYFVFHLRVVATAATVTEVEVY